MKLMKLAKTLLLCLSVTFFVCAPKHSPRDATFKFIYAVLDGDSSAIEQYLNLDMMVQRRLQEVPITDSTQTPQDIRNAILRTLIANGGTRQHWLNQRIIVNRETIMGDSAQVEVSFIDQTTGYVEYSLVYLYRQDGRWRVYFFL